MPSRKDLTIVNLRSFEFLQFLEDEGLKNSCQRETLRDIYYQQFRPICVDENRSTRGASFATVFFLLVRQKAVLRSKAKNMVNFNPSFKKRNLAPLSQNAQRQQHRRSVSPSLRNSADASTSNGPTTKSFISELTSDDFIPLWIHVTANQVICRVCGIILQAKEELPQHSNTRNHRIQGLILALKEYKTFLVQNKAGIVISSPYDGDPVGSVHYEVLEKQKSVFKFDITNNSEEIILFKKYEFLKNVGVFSLTDVKNVTSGGLVKLAPGASYQVNVTSCANNVGRYRTSISFMFATLDQKDKHIHIIRLLACRCKNAIVDEVQPTTPYTPVRKVYYPPRVDIVEGLAPDLENSSQLERDIELRAHRVPNAFRDVIRHKLDGDGLSGQSAEYLGKIRPVLDHKLCWATYVGRFSTMLYAEEVQMELDIRNYDLDDATMNECRDKPRLLTLKVPGLAENRPSVLRGDVLFATKKLADGSSGNKEYKGYVHEVYLNEVGIGFHKQLRDEFVKNLKFSVRFTFNRMALRLMHRSVELADENSLEKILFPAPETACAVGIISIPNEPLRLVNRQLETNTEQLQAIKHILMGTSRPAPYLIFGPPGTGKTVTLVEAIQQVLDKINDAHILACAPSNSAADLIAQRLLKGKVVKNEVYRMCAVSRAYSTVPEDIKGICNYDKSSQQFLFPSKTDLLKYKVIVTTLVTAGRIASANFPSGHFSHVFIDEAGHATEPEAVIALAGIIETDVAAPNGGQVVLAGDPEQLGPILRSSIAVRYGLGISILERLMKTCKIYSREDDAGNAKVYDVRVVTKLLQNYRSHPSILELPNKLYYHSELVACADKMSRECFCSWQELPKKGFPLIFHGIMGQDTREEKSPSFFNPEEVAKVVDYVEKLMENKAPRLKQTDIGVISPYRKQVQKLQQALRKRNWKDIKVGSVEEFQGRENTVIIISTVRSNPEYLAVDAEYKLGFLANPKRFNVAVTRAKALLIVIGNPETLARDKHWKSLLDFCKANSAYTGCYYGDIEEELEDIMQRLVDIKLDDVGGKVPQGEDLPWRNDP